VTPAVGEIPENWPVFEAEKSTLPLTMLLPVTETNPDPPTPMLPMPP
jgi:hypothetical protein